MISCDIIQDLLLLYAADECSEESRKIIDEHLKTCEKCQNTLNSLTSPLMPLEDASKEALLDDKTQNFEFRKGFKKIRNRWLISLIAVILIFPLIGTAFLARNQYQGEGIAFSNLKELHTTRSFLKAIQKRNYDKAFSYMGVEGSYEKMTTDQTELLYNWDAEYTRVKIGSKQWYINKEVYQSDYQSYISNGDEEDFWISMMIYNSQQRTSTAIPEHMFESAASEFTKRTDAKIMVVESDSNDIDYGYTYTRLASGDGNIYYYPVSGGTYLGSGIENALMSQSFCIPAYSYEDGMVAISASDEKIKESAEYYKNLGLTSYSEQQKDEFFSNMKELEGMGITIESFSISNIVYSGNETGEWQMNVNLICEQNGHRTSTGGIIFLVQDDSLTVSGGFYKLHSDNAVLNTIMELLSLNEDVAGFYQ